MAFAPDETTFRHSGWTHRRRLALAAMVTAAVKPSALRRFAGCGTGAIVQRSTEHPDRLRIVADYCKSRWCEPCGSARRAALARNLTAKKSRADLRFLTLTLKSTDSPLALQLSRLVACFKHFRTLPLIARSIHGGVAFIETTYSHTLHQWHPHLHVIFEGNYLPQRLASEAWLAVTGDSSVVDVRAIPNVGCAVHYTTKYATKVVPASVFCDHGLLTDAVTAWTGRRQFSAFGTWYNLALLSRQPDPDDWKTLDTLNSLLRRAALFDRDAKLIVMKLSHRSPAELDAIDDFTDDIYWTDTS